MHRAKLLLIGTLDVITLIDINNNNKKQHHEELRVESKATASRQRPGLVQRWANLSGNSQYMYWEMYIHELD